MKIVVKAPRVEQPPKIWHKETGDIVRLLNNDGKEPDKAYYMVISQEHTTTRVMNVHTKGLYNVSCSIRCIEYQATLNIGNQS